MLKDDPAIQNWLIETFLSTKTTAKELFPENYYAPFSILHDQIFDWIDRKTYVCKNEKSPNYGRVYPSIKKVCAAPRGIGKTTIVKTVAAKAILWGDYQFIPYISQSSDLAGMQTENLKSDLRSPIIKSLWGDIKISSDASLDETFGKKAWVAFGRTLVMPRGAGQQVRGLNWRGHRPQLVIIDDLENKDEIQNEMNRKKLRNWFFSDLDKCINRFKKDYIFIYIDTLKHEDSLLATLLEADDWDAINLSICDENYHSLAPEYMTDEEIADEVESHREKGVLDEFYREYMNIPISTEDAVFMSRYFQYYEEHEEKLDSNARIENVVIIDPAKSVKLHSAESAIIGIGFDRSQDKVYIRDLVARRMHPDELYDEAFNMVHRLKARVLGVEVTGLSDFIVYPLKNRISESRIPVIMNVELIELHATGKKEDRIAHLAPWYRTGKVYHNRSVCGPLEAQLLSFPRSKRWDCMDAEAYFIKLMEIAEKYFYSDSDEEPLDDEALPEDLEPAFAGWRVI